MDYYRTESYINAGLPKITTIPAPSDENDILTQQETPDTRSASFKAASHIPPSLEDVLTGVSQLPYTRNHFLQYLLQRHCLENLEFFIEIDKFVQLTTMAEREYNWKYLFTNFIETEAPKEINLPASVRDHFAIDMVPSEQQLQEASKIVLCYLHEGYVGFISSTEKLQQDMMQERQQQYLQQQHYHHVQAPVPVQRRTSTAGTASRSNTPSSRCISPLSPSDSLVANTQVPRTDDNDLPFEMSDDEENRDHDIDMDAEQVILDSEDGDSMRAPSPNKELSTSQQNGTTDTISASGRNSSVSSNHSASSNTRLNSFVGSFKSTDSNWKKLAKKFKWRRSSYSSSE